MDRQRGRSRHYLTVSGGVAVVSPPGQSEEAPAAAGRWLWAAGITAAGVTLFLVYLRLTNTYPEDSDQANLGLQAWDMLHGNVLLHGWVLSDVSFYTTELPQYMLLELIGGLNTGTFHAAAAMTYTLAVLLAAMLAKGRASGRRGVARALIAGGIMLAPQLGFGVFILLLTVGHIGTSVPLLVTWLVLDRGRPRWQLAVIIGVLLTWGAIADSLVLVVGAVPVALVCALRVLRDVFSDPSSHSRHISLSRHSSPTSLNGPASPRDSRDPSSFNGPTSPRDPIDLSGPGGRVRRALGTRRFEVYLGAAAVASAVVSQAMVRLIHALGGYALHAVTFTFEPASTWPSQVVSTWRGLLVLFGASYTGLAGHDRDVALLHLVGLALAAAGLILVTWRFFTTATLVDQVLAAAIAVNVVLYVVSNMPSLNAHEMAVVLPCAAALAGRMLVRAEAPAARRRRGAAVARAVAATAGAVVLAGYLGGLAREARHPAAPAQNLPLATWLAAHQLRYGLGGYWLSSIITVETGGQVKVRALMQFTMQRDPWESAYAWYTPRGQYANFIVFENLPGFYYHWEPRALVHTYFGDPAQTYNIGPWTVMKWNRNLLPDIPGNPS